MPAAVQRVGLTGGIGSGKSTVAGIFHQLGAAVLDADAISRQLTAVGGAAIPAIALQLGAEVIGPDGAMNRDAVRALAFRDPGIRLKLEAIIHPLVNREMARQDAAANASGQRCLVYDIPLLVESPRWRGRFDRVVVVDCLPSTQINRVLAREMARPGWSRAAVEQIMRAQASRAQRLAAADICVYNEGVSLDGLTQVLRQLAKGFGL